MSEIVLPGLQCPPELSREERRMWLLEVEGEELQRAVQDMTRDLREVAASHQAELSELASLPAAELLASPFGLRASALGIAAGVAAVEHETRLAVPPGWAVREEVEDPDHGRWDRGSLLIGKYQSFYQDEPFIVRNPDHSAKWTPHEMLHRASGFFWRDDMTRWELYLGARLNELVPVVVWYGADACLRLDQDGFRREDAALRRHARLEDAHWLDAQRLSDDRVAGALKWLRKGVSHFERELSAVDRELMTGQRIELDDDRLNASSDALAYVVGHYERLTQRGVAYVLGELHCVQAWRFDDVAAYRERIVALFDEVFFGDIVVDTELARARREERELWDRALRLAHHPEQRAGRILALVRTLNEGGDPTEAFEKAATSADAALIAGAQGLVDSQEPAGLQQLAEGLESWAPATISLLMAQDALEGLLARFYASPAFQRRESMEERLQRFLLESEDNEARLVADLLAFEWALARPAASDPHIEELCEHEVEAYEADGRIVASSSFSLYRFSHDVAALHAALLNDEEGGELTVHAVEHELLIGTFPGDTVRVLPAPRAVRALFEQLQSVGSLSLSDALATLESDALEIPDYLAAWPENAGEWLLDLLEAGALGYKSPR